MINFPDALSSLGYFGDVRRLACVPTSLSANFPHLASDFIFYYYLKTPLGPDSIFYYDLETTLALYFIFFYSTSPATKSPAPNMDLGAQDQRKNPKSEGLQWDLRILGSSPSPPRLCLVGLGFDSGDVSGVRRVHTVGLILWFVNTPCT